MQLETEVATQNVVTQVACCAGLFQCFLKALIGLEDFAVDIVVTYIDAHRESSNRHAFNHDVGVVHQDLTVFASARFTLIRVTNQILLTGELARHEAPLQPCRETCAATTTQA
ncbi:hypothetical protein D3C72_1780260 [compost metagenome]